MIAEKASDAIGQAVCYELQNIVKNYGAVYASSHEAYAVLKEEKEEAAECLNLLESHLEEIWKSIKLNFLDATQIYQAKQAGIGLAEEAVQCAAVCERFLETLGGINGDEK